MNRVGGGGFSLAATLIRGECSNPLRSSTGRFEHTAPCQVGARGRGMLGDICPGGVG